MATEGIELDDRATLPRERRIHTQEALEDRHDEIGARNESNLPPVDGGKHAWLFLAGCFMIEALIWGFAFSFGVFQDYYNTHEPFAGSGNIAAIGTTAMGTMYITAPLDMAILHAFPRFKRWATAVGLIIMCLAFGLSSFSTNTTHLIVTQGIMYAVGGGLGYCPTILFMEEWFSRRRGLAFGVMWAGTGLSGVILPIVLQWLLNEYGFRTTLRAWSVVLFVLTAPLLYFVKSRLPRSQTSRIRPFDFSFLLTTTFIVYELGNVIEALGFFLPGIYLPTYARSLGANSLASSLTVVAVNLSSVFGCIIMGSIVDKYHSTTCILVSTIGSTIGVFLIWGFSVSLTPLYVFCIFYGLFAGSFTSTWPAVIREVQKKKEVTDSGMVFACLAAGRGIGNVVSGPLSEALMKGFPWHDAVGWAYGGGFGTLIVFTGVTALAGGLSIFARPLRLV